MKQLTTIILLILALNAGAQDSTARFIDSVSKKTTLADFSQWLYSSIPAKEFNDKFTPLYNYFLQSKYQAYLRKKKP